MTVLVCKVEQWHFQLELAMAIWVLGKVCFPVVDIRTPVRSRGKLAALWALGSWDARAQPVDRREVTLALERDESESAGQGWRVRPVWRDLDCWASSNQPGGGCASPVVCLDAETSRGDDCVNLSGLHEVSSPLVRQHLIQKVIRWWW